MSSSDPPPGVAGSGVPAKAVELTGQPSSVPVDMEAKPDASSTGRRAAHVLQAAVHPASTATKTELARHGYEALLHGASGLPVPVTVQADLDTRTLRVVPAGSRCCARLKAASSHSLDALYQLVHGRYSYVFKRTIKYESEEDALLSMEQCTTVMFGDGGGPRLDLLFKDPEHLQAFTTDLHTIVNELDTPPEATASSSSSRGRRRSSVASLSQFAATRIGGDPTTADTTTSRVAVTTLAADVCRPDGRMWPDGGVGVSGAVYRFMYHRYMERFILFTIVVNIVVMALSSPGMGEGTYKDTLGAIELACSIIFTLEMIARMVALEGVFPYLDDRWNTLDGTIVVGGWFTELPFASGLNFSALRAFRALRVLRTMKFLSGIREVLDTFASTVGMVAQAMIVYGYFILLFTAVGIDIFGNVLSRQCLTDPSALAVDWNPYSNTATALDAMPRSAPLRFCQSVSTAAAAAAVQECLMSSGALSPECDVLAASGDRGLASSLSSAACPVNQFCGSGESPNSGNSGFGAFGVALMTVFRVSARPPGASFIPRGVMQGTSSVSVLFFVGVMLFVSFLVLSLFVAIVRATFILIQKRRVDEVKRARARAAAASRRLALAAAHSSRHLINKPSAGSTVVHVAAPDASAAAPATAPASSQSALPQEPTTAASSSVATVPPVPPPGSGASLARPPAPPASLPPPPTATNASANHSQPQASPSDVRASTSTTPERTPPSSSTPATPASRCGTLCCCSRPHPTSRVCQVWDPSGRFINAMHALVTHPTFDHVVMAMIMINTVLLAVEHHNMSDGLQKGLAISQFVLTIAFAVEMCLKIVGLRGVYNYCIAPDTGWNRFDAVVVIVTLVDLVVTLSVGGWNDVSRGESSGSVNLSLLRVFRVLRVVRLVRKNQDLAKLLNAIISSMGDLLNLLTFMTLVIMVFAILGMQLFGEELTRPDGTTPRANFDNFGSSMLSLFRLLSSGASWGIYFTLLESESGWAAPVFFLTYTIFAIYITLNFLVVIILSKFALTPDEKERKRKQRERLMLREQKSTSRLLADQFPSFRAAMVSPTTGSGGGGGGGGLDEFGTASPEGHLLPADPPPPRSCAAKLKAVLCWPVRDRGNALWVLRPDSWLRRSSRDVVERSAFDTFIIVVIVLSSATLAIESPRHTPETLMDILFVVDAIFLAIFTVEFLLKAFAWGFMIGPDTYLRDPWNRLDLVVLVATFVSTVSGTSPIGRTLRVGRILRPLRMIRRNPNMKVIINALLRSLPAVAYTVVLLLLFFLVFGILGLNLFMGKFYRCNDAAVAVKDQCWGLFVDGAGILRSRVWENPQFSFDNIGAAFRTLFEVVTLRDWVPVLLAAMDVTDVDKQPKRDNSAAHAVYFVVFIFIGSFYMLKLFVGIIVGHFRQFSGTALLTPSQQEYLALQRLVSRTEPPLPVPGTPFRRRLFRLTRSGTFDKVATLLIILHVVILQFQRASQSSTADDNFLIIHWVFTVIYTVEMALRVAPFGLVSYFRDVDGWWGVWDGVSVVLMFIAPFVGVAALGVARAVRFSRVVRLLPQFKGLRRLLDVLGNCMGALVNVTALLVLVLFVYAVTGMQLFGHTKAGRALNINANFETFPEALLTLFLILGGENWIRIMRDASVTIPECTLTTAEPFNAGRESDCGGPVVGPLFFLSYFVVMFAVILNLYVAAILDLYQSSFVKTDSTWQVKPDEFQAFAVAWDEIAGHRQKKMAAPRLRPFLRLLVMSGHPLGDNLNSPMVRDTVMHDLLRTASVDGRKVDARQVSGMITSGTYPPGLAFSSTAVLQSLVDARVPEEALEPHQWRIRRAVSSHFQSFHATALISQWMARAARAVRQRRRRRPSPTPPPAAPAVPDAPTPVKDGVEAGAEEVVPLVSQSASPLLDAVRRGSVVQEGDVSAV